MQPHALIQPLGRALASWLLAPCLLTAAACGPTDPPDVCGVSGEPPTAADVDDGFGSASLDGESWREAGSWGAGPNASIDVGTLSMVIAFDETGTQSSDLIARRAFPICVPLGERSTRSGNASFDGVYVSDGSHTGGVALLSEENGILTGRFSVDLVAPSNGDEVSLSEGAFRLERR